MLAIIVVKWGQGTLNAHESQPSVTAGLFQQVLIQSGPIIDTFKCDIVIYLIIHYYFFQIQGRKYSTTPNILFREQSFFWSGKTSEIKTILIITWFWNTSQHFFFTESERISHATIYVVFTNCLEKIGIKFQHPHRLRQERNSRWGQGCQGELELIVDLWTLIFDLWSMTSMSAVQHNRHARASPQRDPSPAAALLQSTDRRSDGGGG